MRQRIRDGLNIARNVLYGVNAGLAIIEAAPGDVVPDPIHAGVAVAALVTHAAVVAIDEGTRG